MTTSLSTTDVPLTGPGEGEGNWKRTMGPTKSSGHDLCTPSERGSGEGDRGRETHNRIGEHRR